MPRWRTLAALLVCSVCGLAACAGLGQPQQTAAYALRSCCALHRAEITHVLLTPDQIIAGNTVCAAVGMRLGVD
jgi:hypothetical protein